MLSEPTLPYKIGRDYHSTYVAGSSELLENHGGSLTPLGFYTDVIDRMEEIYPGQHLYVWQDGVSDSDTIPMEVVPIERQDVEKNLTIDELEAFLAGEVIVPGFGHDKDYDWKKLDDRIEHNSKQKSGLFHRGQRVFMYDPRSVETVKSTLSSGS